MINLVDLPKVPQAGTIVGGRGGGGGEGEGEGFSNVSALKMKSKIHLK